MSEPEDRDEMGNDNTFVGRVRVPRRVGSGNTIVGATDANGNAILNRPMSIGAGAGYAPDSVIIGAGAGANLGRPPASEPKEKSDSDQPRSPDQSE